MIFACTSVSSRWVVAKQDRVIVDLKGICSELYHSIYVGMNL